ncbi:OPT family oligopeptide transporter [Neisseria chenwenguii]|uniref:Oligopeptide transporter, OPT family n=1 Tax=Neisseria chenwenguii TaxID=1853278 RepID=A0A220S2F9_9NEIS|nr:oligopeptide transporter, OPT family [Neisseria chenwenguii]ASK27593.1 oligopeptide transporter, OPT family [Neisseria chenwenguii]ROV55520.1 oligopeptide transporter, OPT family [Neisseria chenwenguii]
MNPHDPYADYRELTLRGMILGALITVVFTASNVYLGLKVGLTFASSIPAAVISMAVLKFFKGANILENNMVQTQASSAGTLSTIIFVLPGLLMAGYWNGFPFWQTTLVCMAGGILGVIFTIPLRYAMVVKSELPYPEGVAAAEILKVGSHEETGTWQGGSGIREIAAGGLLAGVVSFCTNGLRIAADSAGYWFKSGAAIFQIPMGFSLALLGAGYLVGLTGGIAILVGIFIAWGGAVPYLSSVIPQPADADMTAFAMQLWKEKVRFIGAGTIGIAAVWTLITLLKPMAEGIRLSFRALGGGGEENIERVSQDLSPKAMILWTLGMMLVLGVIFSQFVADSHLSGGIAWTLVIVCTLLASVIGFLVAAACGYMAGLVGSSSSPISGIGIVSVVMISLVLLLVGESSGLFADEANRKFLLALTLFSGSAVISVASISNDNLQDLKTGYLVKATPWRQQVALIIGCIVGALVISPVLELLYQAYGFTGAMPRENMDASQALAAPQATLMTTIASGIFDHNLQWDYIFIGIAIGVALIIVDFVLKKSSGAKLSLPVLAVGMGIYLPPSVNMPIVVGAVLATVVKHLISHNPQNREGRLKNADRIGTLFSAGLIVGESLVGVVMAFIIALSVTNGGSDAPLALNLENWDTAAKWLGLAFFITGAVWFAKRVLKAGRYSK